MSESKAETAPTSADDAQLAAAEDRGRMAVSSPVATYAEATSVVAAPQPHSALVKAAAAAQPGSTAARSGQSAGVRAQSAGAAERQNPGAAEPAAAAPGSPPAGTQDKVQKRKVALFLAYVGAGYLVSARLVYVHASAVSTGAVCQPTDLCHDAQDAAQAPNVAMHLHFCDLQTFMHTNDRGCSGTPGAKPSKEICTPRLSLLGASSLRMQMTLAR